MYEEQCCVKFHHPTAVICLYADYILDVPIIVEFVTVNFYVYCNSFPVLR